MEVHAVAYSKSKSNGGLNSTTLSPEVQIEKGTAVSDVVQPFSPSQPKRAPIHDRVMAKQRTLKSELFPTSKNLDISSKVDDIKDAETTEGRTTTSKYKRGGKIALAFAIAYGVLAFLGFWIATLGLPALSLFFFVLTVGSYFTALILALKNRKMSKAARAALLVLLISFVLYSTVSAIIQLIYAPTLFME